MIANVPAMAGPADSQVAAQRAQRPIEEIVVTAQKRQETLLDVPMSLTVLTAGDLERQGATTLLDIASTVPGLSTIEFAPGQNRVQLRGISSQNGSDTVGLYLDELPLNVDPVAYGADVRFIDLERIEVLRGPQGTLYGANSMGGTIKYVTRNPDLANASFGFDSAAGTVTDGSALYRGNIIANVPLLEDRLGVRFAGGYEKSPGWIDYPLIGAHDVNRGESKTARLKTLWKASEAFKATLLLAYQNSDYGSQMFADAQRTAPFVLRQPSDDTSKLADLIIEYEASSFTVLSSTGYMNRTVASQFDGTATFAPLYALLGVPLGPDATVAVVGDNKYEILTEEVRIASKGGGPLTWTSGLFYRDFKWTQLSSTATQPNPLPFQLANYDIENTSKQFAAFGQLDYRFTSAFDASLGLRYFRDERSQGGDAENFGIAAPEPVDEKTFTSFNPKLVFSYRPSDQGLVYASVASGFRSGGFNLTGGLPPGCTLPGPYDPEKLWTYEIGLNQSFLGGRGLVQAAVYHNDWKDIQVYELCGNSGVTLFTNGGRASGNGFDLQASFRPSDSLSVSIAGSYNDSQYDDTAASHFAGDRIDYVPMFTARAAGDYSFRWSKALGGRLHLDYQYTDEFSIANRNVPGPGIVYSDAYGTANARLSAMSGLWELYLFGQNLTDTNKAIAPPINAIVVPLSMRPRTIGIGFRYNYE